MYNPEKLETQGAQDEEKQNKTQHKLCFGHHNTQNKQIADIVSIDQLQYIMNTFVDMAYFKY